MCLWGAAIADFAVAGPMDRAGNFKFQDFVQFYVAAKLTAQHRASELFNSQTEIQETQAIAGGPVSFRLPTVYGPQVALFFSFWSRLSFLTAAAIWVGLSIAIYLCCCWWIGQACPALRSAPGLVFAVSLAFPPLFHFAVRGQLSAIILLCFVFALYAFRAGRPWLAGLALGTLAFKPQFLLGIVVVLVLAGAWRAIAGGIAAIVAQLGISWIWFGTAVMREYANALLRLSQIAQQLAPGVAPAQMHSLRSFWQLLVPWPEVATGLYVVSSAMTVAVAVKTWRSPGLMELRFVALVLASVLVSPHLYIYDLLVLAAPLLLLADWTLKFPDHFLSPVIQVLLYLAFVVPLFGPLAIWTHVQISVPVFAALLIAVMGILSDPENSLQEIAA
jgi:hypothetical protein